MRHHSHPQIKVCGLTDPNEAKACAELGADAIGLVFYPKSPRNVTVKQAAEIVAALPEQVAAVGVFVNPDADLLRNAIEQCGLNLAQLHGDESPEFAIELREATGVRVIKALFAEKRPNLDDAERFSVDGFLVECGKGRLPGGNAMTWDWGVARSFALGHPMVLAGGLAPDNVSRAIGACMPDAVDASSGLEAGPGRKDLEKVRLFIEQVRLAGPLYINQKRSIRSILTTNEP